jgi:hypothetical protein
MKNGTPILLHCLCERDVSVRLISAAFSSHSGSPLFTFATGRLPTAPHAHKAHSHSNTPSSSNAENNESPLLPSLHRGTHACEGRVANPHVQFIDPPLNFGKDADILKPK